jgi:NAD(P)-dependent dehydrogenase (short-subunit alcohol dehydrogenase family)
MFFGRPGETKPLSDLVSLRGKRALITGAASGIGRAIAYRFAEAGAGLELVDVNPGGLKAIREELKAFPVAVRTHPVDLARKKEIDTLWGALRGEEPDILVNCAGIYPMRDFLEVDETFLHRLAEINLHSVIWMCQHMIRTRAGRGGVIVNIGSIEALVPFKSELVHYSITKAGVIALTRSLAKDYGRDFRVNALIPGGIVTPGTKDVAKDLFKLKFDVLKSGVEYRSRLPLGRLGRPDEVALMALVLASDVASYVQGALIPVDGGFLSA